MKKIFNSLGSNYDFEFVIKSLFSYGSVNDSSNLKKLLNAKYNGKSVLLYKGREAIKLSLEISGLPRGSKVGVNGFTCFVVVQAVSEAGFVPVYLDIDGRSLNFSKSSLTKNKDIKALIIQNTLGNPIDINFIKSFCSENNILLIEDLPHSAGAHYSNGIEIGNVGDFTALSFSQDKIIDVVSGGALVVRNKKFTTALNNIKFVKLQSGNQIRDRFYPFFTFLIRKLYPIGIGKLLHYFLKNIKVLSDPMGTRSSIKYHHLPGWYSSLIQIELLKLDDEIKHRKLITSVYLQNLNKSIISPQLFTNYKTASNIRFPVFVHDRNSLIQFLKNNGVYVSDIWYDAPVAPEKFIGDTNYNGECPKSELISKQIINLPTHINVSKRDAERISIIINKWLNINQK